MTVDIRIGNALQDGGCHQCAIRVENSRDHDIVEFIIGGYRIRLCPNHATDLEWALQRWRNAR